MNINQIRNTYKNGIDRIYYEGEDCKLYTTNPPDENHYGDMLFELYGKDTYIYKMSGHPYAPIVTAQCLNCPHYSFSVEGSMWYPDNAAPGSEAWNSFCKDLVKEANKRMNQK